MEIVELNDGFFLSKGSERSVYIHPNDKSKVIILYDSISYFRQNFKEKEILWENKKKNLILEGAPGVGKTFMAKRLAYSIIGYKDKAKLN